jgi:hypothetical protein
MNTHDQINKLLAAFALGELSPQQSADVQRHLSGCTRCKDELGTLKALLECAESMRRLSADERQCESAKQTLFAAAAQQKAARPAAGAFAAIESVWRTIMKSPLTKLATAAVLMIAAVVGVSSFVGGTVTFADIVEPILNARTVILDLVIGRDETGPVMHEIVLGSRIRRTISNIPGMVMILDLDNNKMLALDTARKTAGYVQLGEVGDKTQNYIEAVRKIIIELQNKDYSDIEKLASREIDGKTAIGFKGGNDKEKLAIWADPKTALPMRIELEIGQLYIIFKNFEFDPKIEEISMDVPAGYTQDKAQFDLSNATEQDLVESLRIWAEIILDGAFPDTLGTEDFMKQVAVLGQKIPQLDIPDSEKEQLGFKFGKGMIFLQKFEFGGEWRYAGKGVKLGDAATPIFWYQPKGSATYRVIYGDLSVRDAAQQPAPAEPK